MEQKIVRGSTQPKLFSDQQSMERANSRRNPNIMYYVLTAVCESEKKTILQKIFELEGLGISKDEY